MCVYMCVYMCVHVCVHVCACVCMCVYVCVYVCVQVCARVCMFVYMCGALMCVHVCACMYICVCACVHMCVYVCIYMCVCTCVHVCMCVHVCICTHVCTCVHVCMCVQLNTVGIHTYQHAVLQDEGRVELQSLAGIGYETLPQADVRQEGLVVQPQRLLTGTRQRQTHAVIQLPCHCHLLSSVCSYIPVLGHRTRQSHDQISSNLSPPALHL